MRLPRALRPRWLLLYAGLALGLAAAGVWANRERISAAYLRDGHALAEQGQPRSALGDFTLAIFFAPRQHGPYVARAETYVTLGMPARAVSDLDAAIARAPQDAELRYRRGALLGTALNRYRDAIADYNAVLHARPEDAHTWYLRGEAYDRINNAQQALKDLDRALALQPDLFDALLKRAHIQRRFRDHRAEIADLTRALRLRPELTGLYATRAHAWIALRDYPRGRADLDRVVADQPSAAAYYQRGTLHMLLGNPRAAVTDFSAALALDPGSTAVRFNRGQAYRALGLHAHAQRDFALVCDQHQGEHPEACALARESKAPRRES